MARGELLTAAVVILTFAGADCGRARAQKLESPHVAVLPSIVVPAGVELPEAGRVEAVLLVASDGTAVVEQCDASDAICALVRQAMLTARFEPARRDGEAIAARVRIALKLAASGPASEDHAAAEPGPQPTQVAGEEAGGADRKSVV